MRCSTGIPWVLTVMWVTFDPYRPPKHCFRQINAPQGISTLRLQWSSRQDDASSRAANSGTGAQGVERAFKNTQIPIQSDTPEQVEAPPRSPRGSQDQRRSRVVCLIQDGASVDRNISGTFRGSDLDRRNFEAGSTLFVTFLRRFLSGFFFFFMVTLSCFYVIK